MSKKSNSKQQKKESKPIEDEISEDSDFWNMESDLEEIDTSSDELDEIEKILAENKLEQPLKPLSEQELVIDAPCEKDIIDSLDQHHSSQEMEELPDIANKNVDELLASATAEVKAEESGEQLIVPTPSSTPKKETTKESRSTAEKIATLACYLAIIGVFGYLIHYASKQHNFDTAKSYEANTPAQGEYASIVNIETWWAEPESDNTKFGVILVPSATITLGADSTSGVIRSVFYSDEEGLLGKLKPKGDPFTHAFKNGKFLSTGTNQVTVYGTDGFEELAHFIFYRGQSDDRWTIEVKEAPSVQTELDGFKAVAKAPIDPIRK